MAVENIDYIYQGILEDPSNSLIDTIDGVPEIKVIELGEYTLPCSSPCIKPARFAILTHDGDYKDVVGICSEHLFPQLKELLEKAKTLQ